MPLSPSLIRPGLPGAWRCEQETFHGPRQCSPPRTPPVSSRYWASWFGLSLLWLLVLLPWRSQMWLGRQLGSLARKLLKSRVKIARRNLELAMPELTKDEREKLLKQNFESVGCAIFEVGMAWFWPDWRMRNLMKVEGEEHVIAAMEKGQGMLLLSCHFLTLELNARCFGLVRPGSASTVPTPTLCWSMPSTTVAAPPTNTWWTGWT